jgi:hypothetical protein
VTAGVRLSGKATISIPATLPRSLRAPESDAPASGGATITNPDGTRDEYYREHAALIPVRNQASPALISSELTTSRFFHIGSQMRGLRTRWRDVTYSLDEEEGDVTIRLKALREALAAAGAPEDKANRATDELAAAFNAFDRGLADFAAELKTIEGELTFLTWMMGLNVAMTAVVIWRLFVHGV